ncbi:suppression of tumorigenicity 5 protein [Electrophorus electricus]|uniref:UDENN domain-containing protein n=1 Tax=Electrophorus electricus TaxID=8005 RepID=A0A4W4G3W3_ELEEL|nr:suppression of tumorigenicity 5 protein [Electrophorus electricus]XP_035382409.1 suppression of tumorigenicity 5 protein [Electrophorus electricus]XP_035382411.1 suppression of tumorigenicity 5 protein [Electrophorus electricus]
MTANKTLKAAAGAGEAKGPVESPDRCQSVSPPPNLPAAKELCRSQLSDTEDISLQGRYTKANKKFQSQRNWSYKTASLHSGYRLPAELDYQSRLIKAKSIGYLDKKLTLYKGTSGGGDQEQKEKQPQEGAGLGPEPLSWSTLSLAPSTNLSHKRSLSLSLTGTSSPSASIRKKISEWECRKEAQPRMSLCLEKRTGCGSEGHSGLLASPCSGGARRMSMALSECSYPETEEEEGALDRECLGRFQKREREKRTAKTEMSGIFIRSLSARKETSAVLNQIQKIEQVLKESPSSAPPQYLSSCYGLDKSRQKSFTMGGVEDFDSSCGSKRSSICSVATEPDTSPGPEKANKFRQRFSVSSVQSLSPELPTACGLPGTPVNPLPKPKRTFEYDASRNHKDSSPSNGLLNSETRVSCGPATTITCNRKTDESLSKGTQDRESEDVASPPSPCPSPPTENGTASTEKHSRPISKNTLEENAYEDITESMKENPYEEVDQKGRSRKLRPLERSSDPLSKAWTSQDRNSMVAPQLPSKPSSQSLRLTAAAERSAPRASYLAKRHSHDDTLLLPQLGVSSGSCVLLDDSLSRACDTLASRRHRRVPKVVQRINSIYCTKRGKKRLKKLSLSNIEAASLRDDNSESESDSDDRFKAHTQRLVQLQSLLRRAPSYRTLELQLLEWQERELFEYFVVVSLKKKPSKNSFTPEVSYQFPKLDRPTKQMRDGEQRLKAIPQFCFPDAKDWSPVSEYSSETFSFMLTGEDGGRRFGYCRRLLPCGKGPRLPEVYCVISRLGCFDLFSKILDEVERRRGISAALVYPFMRGLMEAPFPAPGKTIKVKTFLPGTGNEVIELCRPMDSRLEHVDFESLFSCLSVRQVVRVFASLLLERRVIFVADKLSTLSSCVHAVVALLYPFSWQHTFIPVLPSSMADMVCCPTPFLVGILSSTLPKLKDLPVEEALMVDLGTDRFIRQLDDEASLLPRKLQCALEQTLEQRNDITNQDSDSESDEECSSLSSVVSEAFLRFFLETVGHYSLFLTQGERGERVFQREPFRKSVASKSVRRFLGVFMESQMFAGFIQDRELRKCRAKGLFEQRVEQYLDELPDTEQSGVNKFLKGLGNKMRFLHKKN